MGTLATKWRPKCFAEVVGQETVVSILSKQIETKTFKNCYLFCGQRGTGKTSVARIMANEINNHEGTPIEIDAASNNGVDNIRQIISEAQQTSIDSDYKVYILDEVHMLTVQAWNAALKLIEEPPEHTIFIFCTTDPEKIPDTILSRVQRFDFKKLSNKQIADRLEFILNEETNSTFEREALQRIAIKSEGHMRDAITLLESCIDYSSDISLSNVEKVLGVVKYENLYNLLNNIVKKETDKALNELNIILENNSNDLKAFDSILKFFIECAKLQKTKEIDYCEVPRVYEKEILAMEDIMFIIDRAFRYRQCCKDVNAKSILNILVLELCGR